MISPVTKINKKAKVEMTIEPMLRQHAKSNQLFLVTFHSFTAKIRTSATESTRHTFREGESAKTFSAPFHW